MASGQKRSHVPFRDLIDNPTDFINKKYFPSNFIWKDPHNMTKAAILELCDHVRNRQLANGIEDAFRFHQYFDGIQLSTAIYEGNREDEVTADRAKKRRDTRRKLKGKQKDMFTERGVFGAPIMGSSLEEANRNIDPLLQHPWTNHGQTHMTVDDTQMQVLLTKGYPPAIPINGPNDGPPLYHISASELVEGLPENDPHRSGPSQVSSGQGPKTVRFADEPPLRRSLRGKNKEESRPLIKKGKVKDPKKKGRGHSCQ
jgi:hypothetical protein